MNKTSLVEIGALLDKARRIVEMELALPSNKTPPGTIPDIRYSRVEQEILRHWSELKNRKSFKARTVRRLLESDPYCKARSDSTVSAILSKWAKEGFLRVEEQGKGPKPTRYKIP